MSGSQREAQRQQLLVRTLWREAPLAQLQGWLRHAPDATARGVAAYRGSAGAIAERALAAAYPTVAALVGAESFAALARDHWQQHAPERGDLAQWGGALPDFITACGALASEPYLADSARLDWLVHQAAGAADAPATVAAFAALGEHGPEALRFVLRPGCAVLGSAWPVAALWQAHQHSGDDRFAAVRAAFAAGHGEQAFVWRDDYAVRVDALDTASAAFTRAALGGASLAAALDAAGEPFAFDRWLARALQQRWLVQVQALAKP